MTQVDFYILPENGSRSTSDFVVQLTEQLYRGGHHLHIHTPTQALGQRLDERLWAQRDVSFVPHAYTHDAGAAENAISPVTLGENDDRSKDGILINLAPAVPPFFSRYLRVVEIIGGDTTERQAGRQRYKYYRDRGYALNSHNI
ncbi:MAG: DNA polymerase III subunit chi [bacterium]